MKLSVLTLLSISIPTIHGVCTVCHNGDTGFDPEINDGKLSEFFTNFMGYENIEITCADIKDIIPPAPGEDCTTTQAITFGFCGCEEHPPDMCTTGYDGALIDLDKMIPDKDFSSSSCRDLVVASGLQNFDPEDFQPFSSMCGVVRANCGNGLTCEICPGGLANPDDPFDPGGDDDESSDEDDNGNGDGNDNGSDEDDDGDGVETCGDAHAYVLGIAHSPETCNDFTGYFAGSGCLCNGGSKSAKSSKQSKAGKSSKAPKGIKSSKAPKSSKEPKATKAPKADKSSKAPKYSKAPKDPKSSKAPKSRAL